MGIYRSKKARFEEMSVSVIAIMLLIVFFLPITMYASKGLNSSPPPDGEKPAKTDYSERNVYRIRINAKGQILAEDVPLIPFDVLQAELRTFILNNGKNPKLSDSPTDAIIALSMERGTKYERFVEVLEIVQGVYYDIYAEQAGMTPQQYCELDLTNPENKILHNLGKKGIPMNISITQLNIP